MCIYIYIYILTGTIRSPQRGPPTASTCVFVIRSFTYFVFFVYPRAARSSNSIILYYGMLYHIILYYLLVYRYGMLQYTISYNIISSHII